MGALFAREEHVAVEANWGICQRMIAADREPDRKKGSGQMGDLIASISKDVPAGLTEIFTLGRTLKSTSAAPPGVRNLTSHIARSLLETGYFKPRRHPPL